MYLFYNFSPNLEKYAVFLQAVTGLYALTVRLWRRGVCIEGL